MVELYVRIIYTYMCVFVHVCAHMRVCVCVCVCMSVCLYVLYVCIVCMMSVYAYECICMYANIKGKISETLQAIWRPQSNNIQCNQNAHFRNIIP